MTKMTEEQTAIIRAHVNEDMINFIVKVRDTYKNSNSRHRKTWAKKADNFLNQMPRSLSGLAAFRDELIKNLGNY